MTTTSAATGARPASAPANQPPSLTRTVVRLLWSGPKQSLAATLAFQRRAFDRATTLVRAFYAVSLFLVVLRMGDWPGLLQRADALDPLWPARWLNWVDARTGIEVILYGYLVAGLLVMAFPQWRLARLAYFLGLLEYMAVINGFGKVNGNLHGWLFVSGFLVLLPSRHWGLRRQSVAERHSFLTVIWACQLVVLFVYTLTGLWKVGYNVHDLAAGRMSGFDLHGFSLIVASRNFETNQSTLLGDFLVRNPAFGWLLYNGTMYLETCSLLIAFRPRLHRAWGFGLLLFHVGTQLAMGFTFVENIALIGLLFLASPAAPEEVSVKDALTDLPGVHLIAQWRRRAARRPDLVAPAPATR